MARRIEYNQGTTGIIICKINGKLRRFDVEIMIFISPFFSPSHKIRRGAALTNKQTPMKSDLPNPYQDQT